MNVGPSRLHNTISLFIHADTQAPNEILEPAVVGV